jgi:hypothetical protein
MVASQPKRPTIHYHPVMSEIVFVVEDVRATDTTSRDHP